MPLHPRHRLDLDPGHLAFAAWACARPLDRPRAQAALESAWAGGAGLCTLSVRSGLDLLLSALAWPAGTEVLTSAITIPDMARVMRAHGLVPVPVDLDAATLQPSEGALAAAVTPRTRAVLVAHLFGGRMELGGVKRFCREQGLSLWEDVAQGFLGPEDVGDPQAQASFFSFGSIKTMTALGGALVRVGDPGLRGRMRALHGAWPVLPTKTYAQKVAKYAAIKAGLQGPSRYGAVAAAVESRGHTLDEAMSPLVKGFPGTDDAALMRALRHQPCAPLVALLHRRLQSFDPSRLNARARLGERVRAGLGEGLWLPGHAQPQRTHWLVPVASEAPERLQALLRQAGFDASVGATSLAVLPPPEGRPAAIAAAALLARTLYVPAYPELGERDAERLLALLGRGLPTQTLGATG